MSTANKKYRNTEYGKEQTRKQHRIWVNNHKDDQEYEIHTNMNQRERYQKKNGKRILKSKDISLGEKRESFGEIIGEEFVFLIYRCSK